MTKKTVKLDPTVVATKDTKVTNDTKEIEVDTEASDNEVVKAFLEKLDKAIESTEDTEVMLVNAKMVAMLIIQFEAWIQSEVQTGGAFIEGSLEETMKRLETDTNKPYYSWNGLSMMHFQRYLIDTFLAYAAKRDKEKESSN